MSLDRRIVSILYYNNIRDVNLIDKFLGKNGEFFEVIMSGEKVKLKIPGNLDDDVYTQFEFENNDSLLKDVKETILEIEEEQDTEPETEEPEVTTTEEPEVTTTEEIEEVEEDIFIDDIDSNIEESEESVDEPDEIEDFLAKPEEVKVKKPNRGRPKKKELDSDIEDFINLA